MARINDTRTEPPGGWGYVQFETGYSIDGGSLPELVERIIAHRRYRKVGSIDPVEVQIDVERQLCQGLESRFCRGEEGENYEPTIDQTRHITSTKAAALSRTALAFLASDEPPVEKKESERRADICRRCQFNRSASGCACSAFNRVVSALVPKGRHEPGVEMCAACGCTLKAKLLLPLSAIHAGNAGREIKFPKFCWQK